ncbi:MAG: protoporphyrinogen oxidase [Chloroflexi bacterium]|nr:protoporphyrinogen oxidase [Chloroflexota bacterium]
MNDLPKPRVAIIGGGITGLMAAWELQKSGQVELALLEATAHWGGKIATEFVPAPDGGQFLIEGGPDSFVSRKPELWTLAQELGLGEQVVNPGSETRHMYILEQGRPVAVPLSPLAFLRSGILSARGKLRLLAEPFIPARRDEADESLHAFATRRLGVEAAERFIGPILAGIYNSDPTRQSILTASPVMREMEKDHGGLVRGSLARGRAKAKLRREAQQNGHDLPPAFFTFSGGAQAVVDTLVHKLNGDLRLNASVSCLEKQAEGYQIILTNGETLWAQAAILAVPANQAAQMLKRVGPAAANQLSHIQQNHIGTMTLAYRANDLNLPFPVQGLMIPRREQRAIDAITCPSAKLPSRAPEGYTLIRTFFGGSRPELAEMDEAQLLRTVRKELHDLLGITAEPVAHRLFQWPHSFPQTDVNHLNRVDEIEAMLPPAIYLAGNSYRGMGVPDCVRQGIAAAHQALAVVMSTIH